MDYALLMAGFAKTGAQPGWSGQRLLHECLRQAIREGTLAAGTRLLASRALARELSVARNSVLYAYEQLATEGFVSTDRRGTVVSFKPALALLAEPLQLLRTGLSSRAQSLASLPVAPELSAAFAPGVPALAEFPLTLWRRLLERSWRGLSAAQLNYGEAAGEPTLRRAIADHLRAARGVVCDAGQVFITDGTQSSLDLCARAFADTGDRVWMENPGHGGALAAWRAAQLSVVGIQVDGGGMAPTAADWRRQPPKLIYLTPSHQYPTGAVLGLERRLALIRQTTAAGALIIEDDYDSEFRHDGPPLAALQGLTPDAPVVYLGTFSKTLFPALRIGFVVAPATLAAALAALLSRSLPRGRAADQLALAEFLRNGHFSLHLRRMRRLYRQRRDALVEALESRLSDVASVHGASAGMHLALRFHDELRLDDTRISSRALQQGIVAPALSQHSVGGRAHGWRGLMLGYAQVPVEQMGALVARVEALIRS